MLIIYYSLICWHLTNLIDIMSRSGNKCAYLGCGKSARVEPGLKL